MPQQYRLQERASLSGPRKGARWGVVVLREGESKNRGVQNPMVQRYYPPEVVQAAAPLFEGAWVYRNHVAPAERGAGPRRVEDRDGRCLLCTSDAAD